MSKSPLRRRITPAVPFALHVEDADGTSFDLTFKLSFDLNALALVEEVTGLSMLTDLGKVFDSPTVTTITALLWAAVQEYHPEYEGVNGLRTMRSLVTIAQAKAALLACTEAFLAQLPKEQADRLKKQSAGEQESPLAIAVSQ